MSRKHSANLVDEHRLNGTKFDPLLQKYYETQTIPLKCNESLVLVIIFVIFVQILIFTCF